MRPPPPGFKRGLAIGIVLGLLVGLSPALVLKKRLDEARAAVVEKQRPEATASPGQP